VDQGVAMPSFKTVTLGCKVNQAESDLIASRLISAGWRHAGDHESADLCILNTCAVTGRASQQSRQAVRHAIRQHPTARMIVTGCYAQVAPDRISRIPGVHEVIGHADKLHLPDRVIAGTAIDAHPPDAAFLHMTESFSSDRTRPLLKIQDGCNAFCTYCIVPHARGGSRSMPMDDVMENIRILKDAGFKEVVLTGIHLGGYGRDFRPQKQRLIDLLFRIDRSAAIDRVRLSSIEPLELSRAMIHLAARSERICRHFHIPLQSGDDEILERMHRPYTAAQFSERVLSIRRWMPDAAVGVDVLIGFPGETDAAFQHTYRLIETLPVSYLHVFPFSPRIGTPASRFPNPVPAAVIKDRCRHMRQLGRKKRSAFYRSCLGKTATVLIEGVRDAPTGYLKGITSNYIGVAARGPDRLKNRFVKIRLERLDDRGMVLGEITRSAF